MDYSFIFRHLRSAGIVCMVFAACFAFSDGPIDAVLIWPVYPNLGVDDRNQFDLLRDLPGGVPALRQVVEKFHCRGVKVFFPILAWDTGTRDEGTFPWVAISQLLKDIGADGVNFDTLESIPASFRLASDASGHPLALEPRFDIRDETLTWSNIGWNDWVTWEGKEYPFVPMLSKSKWLEPRHMVSVTDRFTRDKTDSLQHAFFNGQGYATRARPSSAAAHPISPRARSGISRRLTGLMNTRNTC
jgi:iron(II)-dependent oxidoreductase